MCVWMCGVVMPFFRTVVGFPFLVVGRGNIDTF